MDAAMDAPGPDRETLAAALQAAQTGWVARCAAWGTVGWVLAWLIGATTTAIRLRHDGSDQTVDVVVENRLLLRFLRHETPWDTAACRLTYWPRELARDRLPHALLALLYR